MTPILVLYATREGHTRRIAEHVAATLRARQHAVEVLDARALPEDFALDSYAGAILAASVHTGKHEREMIDFVKHHREELERMPTGFVSVSLTEATVEDAEQTPLARAQASVHVREMLEEFYAATEWHPTRIKAVAGALLYTQYGMLVRFVMKHIAKSSGAPTDTSRDHEFTDWQAIDRFVDGVIGDADAWEAALPVRGKEPSDASRVTPPA